MTSFLASVADTAIITRFQLFRALRSRTLLALCVVYLLISTGGAWVFTQILKQLENAAAGALGGAKTETPGAMLDVLRSNGDLLELLQGLVGDPETARRLLSLPILSVTHFWLALGTLPFLAAAAGAEAVSVDLRERSLRFELVRTGRMEMVMGRFFAQAILVSIASLLSVSGTVSIAAFAMVAQPILGTLSSLLLFTGPLIFWSLPFVGLGIAASQVTATVQLARTIALGSVGGSFILWAVVVHVEDLGPKHGLGRRALDLGADLLHSAMPQGWILELWRPGVGWLPAAAFLLAASVAAALSTFPLFARKDL